MSKQPSSPADRSAAAASSPSASTPPPKNTNKQDCGPIFARWTAVIGNGDVDCATAHAVLNAFQQTDTTRDGAPRYGANIANGWTCDPRYFLRDSVEPHGYSMWCTKEGDTVLTTARGTPVFEGEYVDPHAFPGDPAYASETTIGFSSPSRKWICGFLDTDPENGSPIGEVGCHGPIPPPGHPVTAFDGQSTENANTVGMFRKDEAELFSAGDPRYAGGPTLDYGQVLYARGFVCTVKKDTGISCASPEHGFTASSSKVERK